GWADQPNLNPCERCERYKRSLAGEDLVHALGNFGQALFAAAGNFGSAPTLVVELAQLGHHLWPINIAFQQVVAKALRLAIVLDVELLDVLAEDRHPFVRW